MSGPDLWDFQEELEKKVLDSLEVQLREKGTASVFMWLATGGGKTEIAISILHRIIHSGQGNLPHAWLTDKIELRKQSRDRINKYGIKTRTMANYKPADRMWVPGVVNIVSPLMRKVPDIPKNPGILVVDEAHHTCATRWQEFILAWILAGGVVIGMSGTPWRMSDYQGFDNIYNELVLGPTILELQDMGYLAEPHVIGPPTTMLSSKGAPVVAGEFDVEWMDYNVKTLLAQRPVVEEWRHHTSNLEDRRTLWFTPTVSSARELKNKLMEQDELAVVVTGTDSKSRRDRALAALNLGLIEHLVSVDILSEGIDVPSIPVIATLRQTMSVAKWLQQCGRGARRKDETGGYYILLDFANNSERLGFPDDDREWSLLPRAKQSERKGKPPMANCYDAECTDYGVRMHPSKRVCWHCDKDMYFRCAECIVDRRWTNYTWTKKKGRNRTCRECVEALAIMQQLKDTGNIHKARDVSRKYRVNRNLLNKIGHSLDIPDNTRQLNIISSKVGQLV